MDNSKYIEYAKRDFNFIIKSFNNSIFSYNKNFTKKANDDLEEIIVTDILITKLEWEAKTQTVLKIHKINDILINESKSFFSFITNKNDFVEVIIIAIVDYYWVVDWEESSIPGEVEKDWIYKKVELSFHFKYKEMNNQLLLTCYWDDNGADFGEWRTWPGRPEIMKQYRENPNIINEK